MSASQQPVDEAVSSARWRHVVEALRFGLVPSTCIEEVTVGFDDLARWVEERLPHSRRGEPTFSEICGPFGTGKSHTMAVVRCVAERAGYVTAHVEVDGRSVSLSDPEKFLATLWGSLRIEGRRSSTPLLDLYLKAIEAGHPPPKITPKGVDRVRSNYLTTRMLVEKEHLDVHGADLNAVMCSSSEASATRLKNDIGREKNVDQFGFVVRRMIGRTLQERPHDLVESLVGHAVVAKLAGFSGLALTIDEFEVEHLDPRRFKRAASVLEAVGGYLAGETKHPKAPLAIFVASVGQEGHVGDSILDSLVERTGGERRAIEPISPQGRAVLAERMRKIYLKAYGENDGESAALRLADLSEAEARAHTESESGLIRAFIKSYVSRCDAAFGPPAVG